MAYPLNQNLNKYAIYLAVTNFVLRLIMMIVYLLSIDLPLVLTRSIYVVMLVSYLVLLCYLTYILKAEKNKKSVIVAFAFYICILLINILNTTLSKRAMLTNGAIVLGAIGFISTIFLFIQVFSIKKSPVKFLCILLVSAIFFTMVVNVARPLVFAAIGLSIPRTMYYYVNSFNNILDLFVSAFFVAIFSTLHRILFKQDEVVM